MKNYFQKIITLFTGNDYPESTQQDFYKWLVDEEHTSEKDEALQKLWDEAHKQRTATDMQEAYELLKKNAGSYGRNSLWQNKWDTQPDISVSTAKADDARNVKAKEPSP